jgi:hypothetical protein
MNDPFVAEQTKLWARRVLSGQGQTAAQRVAAMYVDAFGREPTAEETEAALAFLSRQTAAYGIPAGGQPPDVRPWADLAHVLVNVKQFVFVQ